MAYLSENIPHFEVLVRKEFLYNLEKGHGKFIPGKVFGVSCILNRALGFHVMLENGAIFWRLPLAAFCHKKSANNVAVQECQLWDNISYNISVTHYDFLKHCDANIKTRSGKTVKAEYLFTIDYA